MSNDQIERRRPGRPKGSSRYNEIDGTRLRQIAEMMVADATLTKTVAIKRLIGSEDKAGLHRLQGKFALHGETFLTDARRDLAERARQAREAELARAVSSNVLAWKEMETRYLRALTSPKGEAALYNFQALAALTNNSIAQFHKSGLFQRMNQIQSDGFSKKVLEMQRSLSAWGEIAQRF